MALYSIRSQAVLSAQLGIIQTLSVCIILSIASHVFSKNTYKLVIDPIENMLERVNHITSDPLKAIQDEEERLMYEEF